MAIRKVVQCQCDRCGKVEEIQDPGPSGKTTEGIRLVYSGKTISYDDLCSKCRKFVERVVRLLGPPKKREGRKKES